MNYRDYISKKQYYYSSAGTFGNNIYAYEVLTGVGSAPEYYQITKKEFNDFDEWKDETPGELGKMYDIVNRNMLCSAYKDHTEITSIQKELSCPVCGASFLVDSECPDSIDISKICPECNYLKTAKELLIAEIRKQLRNAGLRIKDMGSLLMNKYIDPDSSYDMVRYVVTGHTKYYIKASERGQIIESKETSDVKDAAYVILSEIIYSIEQDMNSYKKYFDKMDEEYRLMFANDYK